MRDIGTRDVTAEAIAGHTWRTTTAVRAFVLAFAVGQILSSGPPNSGTSLALIVAAAAICCAAELHHRVRALRWTGCLEGATVGVLVVLADGGLRPLLVCLALPTIVAGIRHGTRAALLTTAFTAAVAVPLLLSLAGPAAPLTNALGWLVLGLGGGLLGAAESRSARRAAAAQGSYAAAHRLVGQLHSLIQRRAMDLDVSSLADTLKDRVVRLTGASSCTVWVRFPTQDIELLTAHGRRSAADEELAGRCLGNGAAWSGRAVAVVPMRLGDHIFGAVVLRGAPAVEHLDLELLQAHVDEHAIRLDTALLVDGVRASATSAERHRLAREIHDGIAQRVVSLGYLADELLDLAALPAVQRAAGELRGEVSRLVNELRFSVFDLRQDLPEAGLSAALSEYVHQLSRRSDLRVHLLLDEREPRLPGRIEAEVVRIAQEAIANVDKHARALNLWVSVTTDERGFHLLVQDDGVGSAAPRSGHYGMHTMHERAERIGADLHVGPRPDGGTVVDLRSRTAGAMGEDSHHDDPRLARR